MNRRLSSASVYAFCFALALAGCQKSADQAATSSSPSDASAPGAADSSGSSDAAKSAAKRPEPPPPPKPIVVPADTILTVALDQAVGSKISTPGQAFSATVQSPVEVDGRVAIPKGSRASGIVKDAKPAAASKALPLLHLR